MGRRKITDERQMSLPFEIEVEAYTRAAQSILAHAQISLGSEACDAESEVELNVGLVTACKTAIRQSGMSREQILDKVNSLFGRTGKGNDEAKKPLSGNMLNNYLSKPVETRLPTWLLFAICAATKDMGALETLITRLGGAVIRPEERLDVMLGKLDRNIRAGQKLKRQILQETRRSGAAYTDTEDMDHGKEEQGEKAGSDARTGRKRGTKPGNGAHDRG